MNKSWSFRAKDEGDTARLGRALSACLPEGSVVALIGTLGAGKTRLVQAIAEAEGVERLQIVSPTFVVVHEYYGRRPVYHVDAYRIKDDDEFLALGPEEMYEPPGICLIEWADRVANCLPAERLEIRITVTGEQDREFEIAALGEGLVAVVDELSSSLGA